MRFVWWEYEIKMQSKEGIVCLWDSEPDREIPTLQRDSHAEFPGSISISHSAPLMSDHGRTATHGGFSCPEWTAAPRLSFWCNGHTFPPVYKPINPKSVQIRRPLSTGRPQFHNAALPGPEIERRGRTRENQRREAEIKAAQRLIWSIPAMSWRGEPPISAVGRRRGVRQGGGVGVVFIT